jgi:hypothetical protein
LYIRRGPRSRGSLDRAPGHRAGFDQESNTAAIERQSCHSDRGEWRACLRLVDTLEGPGWRPSRSSAGSARLPDAAGLLPRPDLALEDSVVDPPDNGPEHLGEAASAVRRGAAAAERALEARLGAVVEPDVEHRVHHPRHADRRARADAEEEWSGRVAEAPSQRVPETRDLLVDGLAQAIGEAPIARIVTADLGRHA